MAKALLGHVGGTDAAVLMEVRRLRQRVRELEAQVVRLQADNAALRAAHRNESVLALDDLDVQHREPALA